MKLPNPQYLGDGVYINNDGYHVVLTTGSHIEAEANNVIKLEPEVAERLFKQLDICLKA